MPTSANWDAIAYGNGLFVALGKAGVAATSPDGATWTALTLPINADSITFGNGQFVALSSGSNIAVTSPDGLNWTQRTLPSAAPWVGITYGNGLYVAITYGSAVTASSPDGINWSQSAMPESGQWVTNNSRLESRRSAGFFTPLSRATCSAQKSRWFDA